VLQQVDMDSGELLEGFVAVVQPKRRNGFRKGWLAMAQDALSLLATADLTGRDYKVLMALLARLDFDNLIQVNQAEVAREIGIRRSHFSESVGKLIDLGALIEGPRVGVHKTYRLNPRFGWKGSASSHQKALKERMKASRIEGVIEGAMTDSEPPRDPRVADMWDEMQATRDTLPPLGGDGGCPPMPA
jgi:hypothetical protein